MHKFQFYVELNAAGRVTAAQKVRLERYLTLLYQSSVSLFWIQRKGRLRLGGIVQLVALEKRLCSGKGMTLHNRLLAERMTASARWAAKLCRFRLETEQAARGINDGVRMAFGNAPLGCMYQSCLGSNVFLRTDGTLAVCPFEPSEVELNDRLELKELTDLFDTESFGAVLSSHISKRAQCKQSCPYFALCKGGCPLCGDETAGENCLVAAEIAKCSALVEKSDMEDPVVLAQHMELLADRYRV